MPPKVNPIGAAAASSAVETSPSVTTPPPLPDQVSEKRLLPLSLQAAPSPKKVSAVAGAGVDSSPKRFVRNIVNTSISEWMDRCPVESPSGGTGSGHSYVVVLQEMPTQHVTTKKELKQVAKKSIVVGDDSGKTAELVVWGQFACRAWM